MPQKKQKTRAQYPPEFRHRMVELVRSGKSPEELSRAFEPTAQTIRNWVAQTDRDEGRRPDGLTTAERDELSRLKRENRQLREERDILKKRATAWFARESESTPKKGSDS
jgi:transposase